MRVFITGGAGLIGREAASLLLESGHEVVLTDLVTETDAPHTTYAQCDIMDYDAVREHIRGCDAVVHMGALRSPTLAPGQDVFRINTVGTFNVFEAAAQEGIKRIVQASSINAIGCAWNTGDFAPEYLPMDEDHPISTTDPYSFSKQQIEEMGAYFWRRDGISSIALRYPGIYRREPGGSIPYQERREKMHVFLDTFLALPENERQRQLAQAREHCIAFRAARSLEYPVPKWNTPPPDGMEPMLWHSYTFDRYNLWASLDVRDAARAIEKSLTADFEGSHSLFVSNTQNFIDYPSRKLAEIYFPDVTKWKQEVVGSESLVNVGRARELIGFEPQYDLSENYHAENR
jgi:nucleoside-diphosphate-sugar epimerase